VTRSEQLAIAVFKHVPYGVSN